MIARTSFTYILTLLLCHHLILADNLSQELILYQKSNSILSVSIDSAIHYAQLSRNIAIENNNDEVLGKSYWLLGYCYDLKEYHESAVKNYFKAADIFRSNENFLALQAMYQNIGTIARNIGDLESAKIIWELRKGLITEIDQYKIKADIYFDLGLVHQGIGNYDSSVYYFLESKFILDNNLEMSDKVKMSDIYHEIGLNYLFIAQTNKLKSVIDSSRTYFDKALKEDFDSLRLSKIQVNNSELDILTKDYKTAHRRLLLAKKYQEVYGSERLLISLYNSFGRFHLFNRNLDSSIYYLRKSLSVELYPVLKERRDNGKVDYYYLDQVKESINYIQMISLEKNENLLADDTDFLVRIINTIINSRSSTGLDNQRMIIKNMFDFHYQKIRRDQLFEQNTRHTILALCLLLSSVCFVLIYRRLVLKRELNKTIKETIRKYGLN